jgi:DNA-binding NarL/FixJ family response regulator
MIRVAIADDHRIVREGLRQLLDTEDDIEIVAEAVNGHEALARARDTEVDVLVLDLSMPGRTGLDLIKQIKSERPKIRIVVLTMHAEHQYAVRAIKAGASGYLTKDSASSQLVDAIRKVAAKGAFISAEVAERLAHEAHGMREGAPHEALSDREFQVLRRLAAGQSLTDIARQLNLSVKTVSTHKTRLMQKMSIDNQADLIRYAIEHQLTDAP